MCQTLCWARGIHRGPEKRILSWGSFHPWGPREKANEHINQHGVSAHDECSGEPTMEWWGWGGSRAWGGASARGVGFTERRQGGCREEGAPGGRAVTAKPSGETTRCCLRQARVSVRLRRQGRRFWWGHWELVRAQTKGCGLYANCKEKTMYIFNYRRGVIWLTFLNGHCGFCRLSGL